MRRVAWVAAAVVGSAALMGCDDSPPPAAPPGTEAALGTGDAAIEEGVATTEVAATTEAGGMEAGATEAAAATQAPETATTAAATGDLAMATEEADDIPLPVNEPPEMPDVAVQQTEAGAAAFAEHYLDAVGWAFQTRYVPYAASLRTDDCWTCAGLEDAARAMGRPEGFVRALDVSATVDGATAQVDASVERLADDGAPAEMSLALRWEGVWLVQEVGFVE